MWQYTVQFWRCQPSASSKQYSKTTWKEAFGVFSEFEVFCDISPWLPGSAVVAGMDGTVVPKTLSHKSEVETCVSAGIPTSWRNSVSSRDSISGSIVIPRPSHARDLVTMAGPVLRHDGSLRASDQFPGALGRNPTRRTVQSDLRYGWNQIPYSLPATSPNDYLTDLGKFGQTAEARMWLATTTASSKRRKSQVENVGIKPGNFRLTVSNLPANLGNVFCKTRHLS